MSCGNILLMNALEYYEMNVVDTIGLFVFGLDCRCVEAW